MSGTVDPGSVPAWHNVGAVPARTFVCGHCGSQTGNDRGLPTSRRPWAELLILCPVCGLPTLFRDMPGAPTQIPAPQPGMLVEGLPNDVKRAFDETKRAIGADAHTAAVMMARTLIAHVAVNQGAETNKSFAFYVNYLRDQHIIPLGAHPWVDRIRDVGNDVVHDLRFSDRNEATLMLEFATMLLQHVYEMPAKLASHVRP